MHTKTTPGINQGLVDELSEGVVPAPNDLPSNMSSDEQEDNITEDELQREFDKISDSMAGFVGVDLYRGGAIEAGKSYNWKELERVDKGIEPLPLSETISIHSMAGSAPPAPVTYTLDDLLH
jgi:hypothetical protein